MNKLLVVGATGLLGKATIKYFKNKKDWKCAGLSRRPHKIRNVEYLRGDLLDKGSIDRLQSRLHDVTHVLYAALYEMDDLLIGWRHSEQIKTNTLMFQNLTNALSLYSPKLRHVSILQGTKAYGIHVEPMKAPAKEKWPRHDHDNFYWHQEDILKRLSKKRNWSFNIWRPQVVLGNATGSPMNLIAAVAVYATICRETGMAFFQPKGTPIVTEATDAALFARALEWAFNEKNAQNQTFNITNGDVLIWHHLWPEIASYFDVPLGQKRNRTLSTALPKLEKEWRLIVEKYQLKKLTLKELVGGSWQFLDRALRDAGPSPSPSLVSTIKIRKVGFNDCIDTSESIKKYFIEMRKERLIP